MHVLTHGSSVLSALFLNISDTVVQVLNFCSRAIVAVVDYVGSLLVSTLSFTGLFLTETITFLGVVMSSSFNYLVNVLYFSLNYVGNIISGSSFFVLDIMEKIASLKILYSFLFLLSLYIIKVHPEAVRRGIGEIFAPIKDSISEVWHTFIRAVHLVWSSTNLFDVIKLLVIATLLIHLKNYFLYDE